MDSKHFKSITDALNQSIMTRVIIAGFLILLLLIPFSMIQSLIDEREARRDSVIHEINGKWAGAQTITGPILEIPYKTYYKIKQIKNGKEEVTIEEIKHTAFFLPGALTVTGRIIPEVRYRGIYKTTVYTADLEIEGDFTRPDFSRWQIPAKDVTWDDAVLSFGISDMRGINKTIEMLWNKSALSPKPGIRNVEILTKGISANVPIDPDKKGNHSFHMKLNIRGSGNINFLPLGKKTNVQMQSKWKTPSFNGVFLPRSRVIDENGFKAQWEVFEYNREFPQQWKSWKSDKWFLQNSVFGLSLFEPVDEYQKTTRSVKYSILFISLTFLAFFLLIELLNKKKMHPIQYLLVGFALCVFYLLLISLSEHLSFDTAYLISSIAVIALTTFYTKSIAVKKTLTLSMGMIFTLLYAFLYVMLRLEDYSLLVGSFGLFAILAAVMIFTRKYDWYAFGRENPLREPLNE
jgi:inner membrane protein